VTDAGTNITYAQAPLVEVAVSVQFDTPRRLTQAHLGAYWATQRERFPVVHSTQGLPAINEEFAGGQSWLPPSLLLALSEEPDTRVQMTSADKVWVQQVQANRLVVNWRRGDDPAGEYPRFTKTLERFLECWSDWNGFLESVELPPVKASIWEVVYVNRIPEGELWRTAADWPGLFPGLWAGPFQAVKGARLAGLQGRWVWETLTPPARLYVEPKPGRGPAPGFINLLFLTLTARGRLALPTKGNASNSYEVAEIEQGFRWGHDLIVGGFDAIPSVEARLAWGRHDD